MSAAPPHVLVRASAGTGKTHRLTNRYIDLLARGADPAGILATTFTRKAAGEILSRVFGRLLDAAERGGDLDRLRERQRDDGEDARAALTQHGCADLLHALLGQLHRLQILTLDAFFMRLATTHTLELGLAPGWAMLDPEQDEAIRDLAATHAVSSLAHDRRASLLLHFNEGRARRSATEALRGVFEKAYDPFLLTIDNPAAWERTRPTERPLDDEALAECLFALERAPPLLNRDGTPRKKYVGAVRAAVELARAGRWQALIGKGVAAHLIAGEAAFDGVPLSEEHVRLHSRLVAHATAVIMQRFHHRAVAVRDLMAAYHEALRQEKRRSGRVSFDDVTRALRAHRITDDAADLYYRLDARLDHLMLDEFQDTSIDQFAVLEPIMAELLGGESDRSVLVVGDEKQSLYMWRRAEPELLPALPEKWPQLVQQELSTSYRSSPVVIEAVNRVFSSLHAVDSLSRALPGSRWPFTPSRSARTELPGSVVVRSAAAASEGGTRPSADERRHACFAAAVERACGIMRAAPSASVAILTRTNKSIAKLVWLLTERGVAASAEGGNALTDAAPVAVAVSLLRFADHPGDSMSRFHVATSPMGPLVGLDDPLDAERAGGVAASLRRAFQTRGYADTLAGLLRETASSMDSFGLRRFQQLIDLAREYDDRARTDPAAALRSSELARIVASRHVEDPGSHAIRVMTIHRAKGLEFDAVILPELDKPWELRDSSVIVARDGPFATPHTVCPFPNKLIRALSERARATFEAAQRDAVAGEVCALYVAMTRARCILELILQPDERSQERDGDASSSAGVVLRSTLGIEQSTAAPVDDGPVPAVIWTMPGSDEVAVFDHLNSGSRVAAPETRAGRASLADLRPSDAPPTHRLRRVSPSRVDDDRLVSIESLLSETNDAALDRGTMTHALLQHVNWLDPGDDRQQIFERLRLVADTDRVGHAPDVSLLEQLSDRIARSPVRELFMAPMYSVRQPLAAIVEVRREWPFAIVDRPEDASGARSASGSGSAPTLLTGTIDRLVLGRAAPQDETPGPVLWAEIVDFKTDDLSPDDPAAARRRAMHHAPQLNAYRRAVAQAFSIPTAGVTARVAFVLAGRVETVDPSEP